MGLWWPLLVDKWEIERSLGLPSKIRPPGKCSIGKILSIRNMGPVTSRPALFDPASLIGLTRLLLPIDLFNVAFVSMHERLYRTMPSIAILVVLQ